ncbi:MAG: hypothetical protein Q8L37_01005 [Candidatus Gottesmanbacteria bacterium]|nr:hypothetical protein [Candidatus Gottesmanbacteria bacterium]
MQQIIKYIVVAAGSAAVVAIASLLWPKFTDRTEPLVLNQVRGAVLGTEVGQNTAKLLGVTGDGGNILNFSDTVSSVAGIVTSSVEQKVAQIVSDQVASQVVKQYNQLPIPQQNRVVEMICKPKE